MTAPRQSETTLESLTARLIAFRDNRDWRQFHSLKDLIISLNLEASELLELTQWASDESVEAGVHNADWRAKAADECADVLLYLLLIAERAGIDLLIAAEKKIDKNELKYPVDKARGNARKYTEL
jgi:NTP pyrophosphatase (non-canonical NTP hydrolase)